MNVFHISILCLTLGPVGAALAQVPATNPSGSQPAHEGGFRGMFRGRVGGGTAGLPDRGDRPTRPEADLTPWPEIEKFLQDHSPKRWEAWQALKAEQQDKLRPAIVLRFRAATLLGKDASEETRKNKVKQFEVEDDLFGLRLKHRKAGKGTNDEARIRDEMRVKATELVELRMRERELRIEHLRSALKQEETQLTEDQKSERKEQLIAQRVQQELAGGPAFGDPRPQRGERRGERPDRPDRSEHGPSTGAANNAPQDAPQ